MYFLQYIPVKNLLTYQIIEIATDIHSLSTS
jgi:hypothetical protein